MLDTVEKYMGIKNGKMNNIIIYNLAVTTQTLHPSNPKLSVANRAGTAQIVLALSVPILEGVDGTQCVFSTNTDSRHTPPWIPAMPSQDLGDPLPNLDLGAGSNF